MQIELEGWNYPRHLKGRLCSVVVHGDVEDAAKCAVPFPTGCASWRWPRGPLAEVDRYIGSWKPYATSHDELDRVLDIQEEVRYTSTRPGDAPLREAMNAVAAGWTGRAS